MLFVYLGYLKQITIVYDIISKDKINYKQKFIFDEKRVYFMNFDYILVRYGEIALKGKNRYRFEDRLIRNMRNVLKDKKIKITKSFGRIFIELNSEDAFEVMDRLKKVFGLVSFSPVKKTTLDIEEIKNTALAMLQEMTPAPNTFKVEAKRSYKRFPLISPEIQYEIGAHLLRNTDNIKVDVHNPETTVTVEIREEGAYIFTQVVKGVGGMPGQSSGKGMLLLSGGIDSPVAAWFAMKRGVLVEGVHFHTYPVTTEESVQKVIDLGKILANFSGQFVIHFVPFLEIQKEIREYAPESHYITIMRRIFLRIADKLAEKRKGLALITGESLAQVASQTLESMNTINHVTNTPIIRPLITMDKTEIIDIAKEIGTYETSIRPFEDCCSLFVPRNPATKPSIEISEKAEGYMDIENLIEDAVNRTKLIKLTPHDEVTAKDILFNDIKDLT